MASAGTVDDQRGRNSSASAGVMAINAIAIAYGKDFRTGTAHPASVVFFV
jgi:hypothetical protein